MFKIQVLVSGAGSTLDNLAEQCYDDFNGRLHHFVNYPAPKGAGLGIPTLSTLE